MNKGNGSSIFSQILSLFNRTEFSNLVHKHQTEKHSKGFSSWDHFVSMLFCQLASAKSLREICYGLKSCGTKLNHLSVSRAPTKSTLSYANSKRSYKLFEDLFYEFLKIFSSIAFKKKKKFKFKNKLLSIDASTIDLCMEMFDWAKYKTTKGAVKLHLVLDHEGYLPSYLNITNGDVHEVNIAKLLSLPPESIVAMDKGYNDYNMFYKWNKKKVYFVTRLKTNAAYEVLEERKVPEKNDVVSDQVIKFKHKKAFEECPINLRKVEFYDKEKDKTYIFLTNNMKLAASTIANIYKDRWEIELFFKLIKQNLKIKTFVGTTANAVHIQIWTAMISILILKFLKFKSSFMWSMSNMIALLRWNLMIYRNLYDWLDNPFMISIEPPDSGELQKGLFD